MNSRSADSTDSTKENKTMQKVSAWFSTKTKDFGLPEDIEYCHGFVEYESYSESYTRALVRALEVQGYTTKVVNI
jgi:hypothetical protein